MPSAALALESRWHAGLYTRPPVWERGKSFTKGRARSNPGLAHSGPQQGIDGSSSRNFLADDEKGSYGEAYAFS